MFRIIANKKGTSEWFNCEVEGRVKSALLDELLQDERFLHLYEKNELQSEYFDYYVLKTIKRITPCQNTNL